jgi:hypothetical protein
LTVIFAAIFIATSLALALIAKANTHGSSITPAAGQPGGPTVPGQIPVLPAAPSSAPGPLAPSGTTPAAPADAGPATAPSVPAVPVPSAPAPSSAPAPAPAPSSAPASPAPAGGGH